ncbi:unnamed protein product [Brassicogethes aeneus]|uniref:Cuticle protein CPCFC domain-containing protein n=1 Tax=Brassicogethes aeneus TaxID=1431903 RepID=A0A9P0FDM7_BRAAE|nr:unnamed protein product [Brassicogethes aeneus]
MFVKLTVFACSLALAIAAYNGPLAGGLPAAKYPAGIDPASCPDFPNCNNPLVAISNDPAAVRQFQPAQQPQHQQYQPQQYQPQQYQQPRQYQQPQQQYQGSISQYNPVLASQYQQQPAQGQYSSDVQNALNEGKYIGDGDYHGEGLAEALAPGHVQQAAPQYQPAPQYNQYNSAPQYQQYNQAPAVPAGHAQPAQIPAGVDPNSCPNYPYCH